jgi:hypothetical protein
MQLLCKESVECDRQAKYRQREQSAVPALEDVCVWVVQYQQSCSMLHQDP